MQQLYSLPYQCAGLTGYTGHFTHATSSTYSSYSTYSAHTPHNPFTPYKDFAASWEMRGLSEDQLDAISKNLEKEEEEDFDEGDYILCRNCKNIITTTINKIEMYAKHQHTFTNPRGFIYKIGCFSSAPGVLNQGAPTTEFTWFPGFSWCYSLCVRCFAHLGWFFQSGDKNFFGLILDHLIEAYHGHG